MIRRLRVAMLRPALKVLDTRIAKPPPKTTDPIYSRLSIGAGARPSSSAPVAAARIRSARTRRVGMTLFADHIVELRAAGAARRQATPESRGSCSGARRE